MLRRRAGVSGRQPKGREELEVIVRKDSFWVLLITQGRTGKQIMDLTLTTPYMTLARIVAVIYCQIKSTGRADTRMDHGRHEVGKESEFG